MNATATTARTLRLGNGLEVTIDERGDAAGSGGTGGAGATRAICTIGLLDHQLAR